MRPRWRKVLSDFSGNPIRSILVILSIAVGLFAVGMIITIDLIIRNDIIEGYEKIHPANIQIVTIGFSQDILNSVKNKPGVENAIGVRKFGLHVYNNEGNWEQIDITALKDFKDNPINQLILRQGNPYPDVNEILLDQNKIENVFLEGKEYLYLELPSGERVKIRLSGVVKDQTIGSDAGGGHFFIAPVQGYVNWDTLLDLEQPQIYNRLMIITTQNYQTVNELRTLADAIGKFLEDNNVVILHTVVRESDAHPNAIYIDAIAAILIVLGFLVVFLSGFLITNTLSALMNQQIKQIGIMKSVGARRKDIVFIYMVLILLFGLIAFILSVPTSREAGFSLMQFLADQINFLFLGKRILWIPIIFVLLIALIIPQLAGFLPILHGSKIKVQQAFSGEPIDIKESQDSTLLQLSKRVKSVPRPLLLSIRNTFRRRGRVFLTIFTLMLGGAIFISTFNVQNSLKKHIQRTGDYFLADVNLVLDRPYRIERIQAELAQIPQIAFTEGWAFSNSEILLENDMVGDSIYFLGPPAHTSLIQAKLMEGRWLRPGDHNMIVLNEVFLTNFPDLHIGDDIRLRVSGKETSWKIVGFFQMAGKSGGYIAYTDYDSLATISGNPNRTAMYRIAASQKDLSLDQQKQLAALITDHLRARGYQVVQSEAGLSLLNSTTDGINILTIFLLIMALLMALVGSIGLTGTMSLNVMERTRELGIMRAIGASDRIIIRMVIIEGLVIGLTSWLVSIVAAIPITKVLGDQISNALFDSPGLFSFTPKGILIWLGIVVLLSILASVIPAWNAARLTIREVLAYE